MENPQDQFYPQQGNKQSQSQSRPLAQNQSVFNQGYQNRNQFQGNNSGNNGFQQKQQYGNFQAHGNASTSQSSQDSEIKQMLQMVLEEQKRSTSEINSKVDNMYGDLNGKFEALNTHMKVIETQVAQASSASRAPPGTLLGKPEVNPKAHCNAVSAREDEEAEESEDETEKKFVENGTINPLPKSVEPESSVKSHASTSSERVYVPRIPYLVVPQHLREPINEKTLENNEKDPFYHVI